MCELENVEERSTVNREWLAWERICAPEINDGSTWKLNGVLLAKYHLVRKHTLDIVRKRQLRMFKLIWLGSRSGLGSRVHHYT